MLRSLLVLVAAAAVMVSLFFFLRPDPRADGTRERTFEVSVGGGEMDPAELRVGEGDRVALKVESGRPLELHLHGYGIERQVEPGERAAVDFEADLTGRFGIEDHHSGEDLGVLLVEPR